MAAVAPRGSSGWLEDVAVGALSVRFCQRPRRRLISQLGLVSAEAQRSELGLDAPAAAEATSPARASDSPAPGEEAPPEEAKKKQ